MRDVTNPIRRRILKLLVERRDLTRSELAKILAADPEIQETDPEHLEIVLHHNHLPKLDADSFIEYDPRNGDIIRWAEPDEIGSLLP